ncbi:polyribonucleotide nucleotidyltransferase [Atopomonas sediminilitoris]|uniref:polyribonucleotide nucleotidyltransferase n=1 Tax=Atopomonas sediminilitoris TaxID=2919919 RepID=UPI001F4E382E|nr:polyribonucleotide nucleotidyltransferase [Atopomonas sediminilitoris]MCJ8168464.1 polyribonucleotide nucleotidyltransferase [Atopomonas sediminilitoris]
MPALKPLVAAVLSAALVTQLSACGTLFYPERRGQIEGRIDPAIAILDGIGILFYVVPGLIAFAVDFATGAIYLPDARYSVSPETLAPALNADGSVDEAKLQVILQQALELNLPLNHPNLQQHSGNAEQLAAYGLAPAA